MRSRENKGDADAVKKRLQRGFQGKKSIGFKESRAIRKKELRRSNRVLIMTIIVLLINQVLPGELPYDQ